MDNNDNNASSPTKKLNLLIGMSGSVAVIRVFEIIQGFNETGLFNIKVIFTEKGLEFVKNLIPDKEEFEKNMNCEVYYNDDGFVQYHKNSSTTLHIDLRKWADLILLAPLSANTLAKITNGLCDNLLTTVVRAWDFKKKGFFCLAMNNHMYDHFITRKQIDIMVNEMKFVHIPSVSKRLKCGDVGIGGIASTFDIIRIVCEEMGLGSDVCKSEWLKDD